MDQSRILRYAGISEALTVNPCGHWQLTLGRMPVFRANRARAEKCIMYGMWIRRKLCWLKHTINAQLTHQNGFVVSNASCTGDDIQIIFTM